MIVCMDPDCPIVGIETKSVECVCEMTIQRRIPDLQFVGDCVETRLGDCDCAQKLLCLSEEMDTILHPYSLIPIRK